jgi:transposase-like protein
MGLVIPSVAGFAKSRYDTAMITITIACPYCQETERVIKHGTTKAQTPRCRCLNCKKTFILQPKSRTLTQEKEDAILRHLEERTTIRGICRALKVSPNTIYAVLKKNRATAAL